MIRALAVDIDGTLTDKNRVLCPAALAAIKHLEVLVILVTGNTHCFTRTVSVLLGTPRIFIGENGGIVSHSEEEMEILADPDICERAFQELVKVYPLDRFSSSRYRFTDIALSRNFDVEAASAYAHQLGLEVELIDTTFAVHIKDKRVNKGTGLRRVAERMGISLAEFGAVGDSNSDLPMFELAGFRAAVANATPELKAASDYVADAEYGEGFAQIVKYMADKGLF